MRGYDAFAGVIKSGGKTRRAAKMVILDVTHPDVIEFIECKAHEEKKAWALIEQGYDPSFTGEAYGSVFFQNANHSVRVTDDFMQAVERDARVEDARGHRRPAGRHVQGARDLPQDGRGRPPVRRPGHPVRHHHQRLAHEPEHGPDLRVQPVLGVHVPQRHGVQPGQPEPDEVRAGGRRVRRRRLPLRGEGDDHGAGDPGRQRQLSRRRRSRRTATASGRWAWATRTWAPAHEPRPGLRLRRGPRLRRRHHRADARRGLSPELRHRPRPRRRVRRLRRQPRAVPARHRQAPRRGLRPARDRRARRPCWPTPAACTTRSWRSARPTASATPRSPCWPPPAPSRS